MNRYGRMALDHWRTHRPAALATIADPDSHFSRLGVEVETQMGELTEQILGGQRPGEDLEAYRLRSYQARRQAEEIVLDELVWTESEPATTEGGEEDEILAASHRRLDLGSEILSVLAGRDNPAEDPRA